MELEVPNRWVVLRLRVGPDRMPWVGYEDDAGNVRPLPEALPATPPAGWSVEKFEPLPAGPPLAPALGVPADLFLLIERALGDLAVARHGPHVTGPVPLAVFVDLPRWLLGTPWPDLAWTIVGDRFDRDRLQPIVLARPRWERRAPFRLPLRLLAVGAASGRALGGLRMADWYVGDFTVQEYGLRMAEAPTGAAAALVLEAEAQDIVVTDTSWAEDVLRTMSGLPTAGTRPRCLVVFETPREVDVLQHVPVPDSMSLLAVPRPLDLAGGDDFLRQFVYAVIHDHPLHEAVRVAIRVAGARLEGEPRLVADPASNHDLRMADAMAGVMDEAMTLELTVAPGDVVGFLGRVGEAAPAALGETLGRADALAHEIRTAADEARALRADFGREQMGLRPMCAAEAALDRARRAVPNVLRVLAEVAADEASVMAVRERQERRADVDLERLEYSPLVGPWDRAHSALWVEPTVVLRRGARYRMRVQIGRPLPTSLMVGTPPPLDPLLPEVSPEIGHTLDVAVYERDFTALSSTVQSVFLPPLGSSQPLYFEIRAPEREGGASLRIGIYHANHLLQAFVLDARVEAEERQADHPVLTVRLDFSRTARFANLDRLGARALSIGVNRNADGRTHSFMMKRNGVARAIHLAEGVLTGTIAEFRRIMLDATHDEAGHPRFLTEPPPGAPPSSLFPEVIRFLSRLGSDLHDALYTRGTPELQAALRSVASSSDDTIQVVRHDPNYVFPWSIVYDFAFPTTVVGEPPPPVCLGGDGGGSPATGIKTCAHGPDRPGVCVYGFWSVRHRLEELIAPGDANPTPHIVPPAGTAPVRVAVGIDDVPARALVVDLRQRLGAAAVAEVSPGEDLLDLLWQPATRPAVLIVLGHLATAATVGEPEGPRIVIVPGQKWLQAKTVTSRAKTEAPWEERKPAIFLMACGSGATETRTLNDFVIALTSAGASVVVGTECLVFSALVARFAREVTADLWNHVRFGAAVTAFRRRLLAVGNPLAFVFNPVGDADVTIVR